MVSIQIYVLHSIKDICSRIVDCSGEALAASEDDQPAIIYADIDPVHARAKHRVIIPGQYELHRTADRRPEMYGALVEPATAAEIHRH